MDVQADLSRFSEAFMKVDWVYGVYAKSIGLNDTGLSLLYLLYYNPTCTQTFLAEQMMLPKQTVHSIVKLYEKQGFLELVDLPEDKRQRGLQLTPEGREFASTHIPRLDQAERNSMAQFTPEERELLTSLMERYVKALTEELL